MLEQMDQLAKEEAFDPEQVTIYNCHKCQKVYCGGKNDFDGAVRESMGPEVFLCQKCSEIELGYGKEMCDLHGNEFCDFKCSFCCSIALFVIDHGNTLFCQPCFNDHMEKKTTEVKTECEGGRSCSLKISTHPKAPEKFPLGCSICRSEKLSMIVS